MSDIAYKRVHIQDKEPLPIRAGDLLCLRCLNGGAPLSNMYELEGLLLKIKADPDLRLRIETDFDEVGVPTSNVEGSPIHRKRDLDVLQRLGLVPGSVRTARELFRRVDERIPNLDGICLFEGASKAWGQCSGSSYYSKGAQGLIVPRDKAEMEEAKKVSVQEIAAAEELFIRPHHLMCITCFIGGGGREPLAVDNLYEVWVRICQEPEIPITLVEGCCMICPPCHAYDPKRNVCITSCGLRDRKKDLDVLQRLDLMPGDTLPARQLYSRLFETVPTPQGICDYGDTTSPEWESCGGSRSGNYEKGRKMALFR